MWVYLEFRVFGIKDKNTNTLKIKNKEIINNHQMYSQSLVKPKRTCCFEKKKEKEANRVLLMNMKDIDNVVKRFSQ